MENSATKALEKCCTIFFLWFSTIYGLKLCIGKNFFWPIEKLSL
jgi:hypothetical protein